MGASRGSCLELIQILGECSIFTPVKAVALETDDIMALTFTLMFNEKFADAGLLTRWTKMLNQVNTILALSLWLH